VISDVLWCSGFKPGSGAGVGGAISAWSGQVKAVNCNFSSNSAISERRRLALFCTQDPATTPPIDLILHRTVGGASTAVSSTRGRPLVTVVLDRLGGGGAIYSGYSDSAGVGVLVEGSSFDQNIGGLRRHGQRRGRPPVGLKMHVCVQPHTREAPYSRCDLASRRKVAPSRATRPRQTTVSCDQNPVPRSQDWLLNLSTCLRRRSVLELEADGHQLHVPRKHCRQ
jgi:hypothetical protein